MTTPEENGEFVEEIIMRLSNSPERAAKAHHVQQVIRDLDAAVTADDAIEVIVSALIDANERSYQIQLLQIEYMYANAESPGIRALVRKDRKPMTTEEWDELVDAFNTHEEVTS